MRRNIICLLFLGLLGTALSAQSPDALNFPQPQYVNPIFDSFTRNYMSTSAMGRGYTGLAILGGVDNVLKNPAGYRPDKASLHLEMLVKPPVESDIYAMADTSVYYRMTKENMLSPVPVGIVGGGGTIGPNFTYGLLYSMPKSIKVDNFGVEVNMGYGLIMRYPSFFLNQLTANAAWHKDNFHVGLNLHNQIYHLGDVTFLRSFERIISDKYVLRPQLGLLYSGESLSAGLSMVPQQNVNWDLKFAQYDTRLPLSLALGVAYNKNNAVFTAEVDYEQCSAISDAFKDRYTFHAGLEKTVRRYTYRAGYIYHPQVWEGDFLIPDACSDTISIWWAAVLPQGRVGKNNQHILTLGTSWNHPDVRVNLSGLIDVAGQAPIAQVSLSADLFFSAFKRKNFLYFD
jgi:hypothetical protein